MKRIAERGAEEERGAGAMEGEDVRGTRGTTLRGVKRKNGGGVQRGTRR